MRKRGEYWDRHELSWPRHTCKRTTRHRRASDRPWLGLPGATRRAASLNRFGLRLTGPPGRCLTPAACAQPRRGALPALTRVWRAERTGRGCSCVVKRRLPFEDEGRKRQSRRSAACGGPLWQPQCSLKAPCRGPRPYINHHRAYGSAHDRARRRGSECEVCVLNWKKASCEPGTKGIICPSLQTGVMTTQTVGRSVDQRMQAGRTRPGGPPKLPHLVHPVWSGCSSCAAVRLPGLLQQLQALPLSNHTRPGRQPTCPRSQPKPENKTTITMNNRGTQRRQPVDRTTRLSLISQGGQTTQQE